MNGKIYLPIGAVILLLLLILTRDPGTSAAEGRPAKAEPLAIEPRPRLSIKTPIEPISSETSAEEPEDSKEALYTKFFETVEAGYGPNHPTTKRAAKALFTGNLEEDLLMVIEVIDSLQDPSARKAAGGSLFRMLVSEFPPRDLIEGIRELFPEQEAEGFISSVVGGWISQNPSEVAGWFLQNQSPAVGSDNFGQNIRAKRARSILNHLYKESPSDGIAFWAALDSDSMKRTAIGALMYGGDDLVELAAQLDRADLTPAEREIAESEIAAASDRRKKRSS